MLLPSRARPIPAPAKRPANDLYRNLAAAAAAASKVREFAGFGALPARYDRLFAEAGQANVCLTRDWFEMLARHEGPEKGDLRLLGLEAGDHSSTPDALLAGRHRTRDRLAFGGRSFTSLDNFYTLLYAPLTGPATGAGDPAAALEPLIARLCNTAPAYDAIRLQALDRDAPAFDALQQSLRAHGFAVQTYRHFGNRFEPTIDVGFADYLGARPARLRHTIARKARRLERLGTLEFTIEHGPANLDATWADYERVYAAGWKAPELLPGLMRDFAGLLADAGALRLGLLRLDGAPIAAQLWIVWRGVASVYKLSHDRALDAHSPGTVLTARMIEHLLEAEGVHELDFGPGDNAYKQDWTSRERERWGMLAFNPRTVRGRLGIARHIWGRAVKRAVGFKVKAEKKINKPSGYFDIRALS